MLKLRHAWLGSNPTVLHHLLLPHTSLLLYPSADSVVILDAHTLQLVRILPFFDAFPATIHTNSHVSCISVDPAMKLIVASMDSRIAAWTLSGIRNDSWVVHSTITLSSDYVVTALDNKSGLLAVGTVHGLSVYTLILENDLPTWALKWSTKATSPFLARFSPSLMLMAAASHTDSHVRLYSTTTGRQTQTLRHPRPIETISWRFSEASSRDDPILYTTTVDSTLRIFLPVLDAPTHLQLHASLDLFSSLPDRKPSLSGPSSIFELRRDVISSAFHVETPLFDGGDALGQRLREIRQESFDLFLRILLDGTIIMTAVAGIDHRPPALLRQFTLQHTLPNIFPRVPSYLNVVPENNSTEQSDILLHLVLTPPLSSYSLSFPQFLDPNPHPGNGLTLLASQTDAISLDGSLSQQEQDEEQQEIIKFIRTPDGQGVVVLRTQGYGGIWRADTHDYRGTSLARGTKWQSNTVRFAVVLDGGRSFATYDTNGLLALYAATHLPSLSLQSLPQPPPECVVQLPELASLFSMPAQGGSGEGIIGITPDYIVYHIQVHLHSQEQPSPSISILSASSLPLSPSVGVKHILPVDPMAWSRHPWEDHDVLLSVSADGELAFWGFNILKDKTPLASHNGLGAKSSPWRSTGRVRTGKSGITKARCSSAKKSALVVCSIESDELTIWDSKESEFASGLEYRRIYSDKVNDLDWTSTPDAQSILAVGFPHRVELLCQQRMTYFDDGQGWIAAHTIDLANQIPYAISDSIWLANGSFLIGTGHQMFLFDQSREEDTKTTQIPSLFEFVARQNGALEDYHPQMLLQCLLWAKVELVKDIIVILSKHVLSGNATTQDRRWPSLPTERYFSKDDLLSAPRLNGAHKKQYSGLFSGPQINGFEDEPEVFSRPLVTKLIRALEVSPLQHLTENENAHLLVLIQTTLEVEEQRRALDANGLRYLISMRSFYILNRRANNSSNSSAKHESEPRSKGHRERLRYRDMVWAFHSESQELLMNVSTGACRDGKMVWSDARALGVPLWLTSVDALRSHFEIIARNEYMAGENRDPTSCSLFYFALKKSKLVHGLWRQAAWHKEQGLMLKFLANDFSQPKWQTAALKNAFALLSKQRFEYAAAFFLLGGSLKDAVNVCLKQLSDWQLAIALARIVEQSNHGPIYQDILKTTVLPNAIRGGNRYLGSWAFWQMHRRDLAVRILVTPLQDIAAVADLSHVDIGEPHYDDPSLALLYSQLKGKTLQAVKGTSEISGRMEFNFVLQIARVFRRMGCHALAIDLVRSWSFERPSYTPMPLEPVSPISPRRPSHFRRRSSIMIDMDLSSDSDKQSTKDVPPSPMTSIPEEVTVVNDLSARKVGLGNLMKSARQDVSVPEFDMSSFGF